MNKAFTLIELLIIIAIIGILSSIILVQIGDARNKAWEAKYISYIAQVTMLVEGTIASGELNGMSYTDSACPALSSVVGCLGNYPDNFCFRGLGYSGIEGGFSKQNCLNKFLERIGTIPSGEFSPYANNGSKLGGVGYNMYGIASDPGDGIRIIVYVGSSHTDICNRIGWMMLNSDFCFRDIPFK